MGQRRRRAGCHLSTCASSRGRTRHTAACLLPNASLARPGDGEQLCVSWRLTHWAASDRITGHWQCSVWMHLTRGFKPQQRARRQKGEGSPQEPAPFRSLAVSQQEPRQGAQQGHRELTGIHTALLTMAGLFRMLPTQNAANSFQSTWYFGGNTAFFLSLPTSFYHHNFLFHTLGSESTAPARGLGQCPAEPARSPVHARSLKAGSLLGHRSALNH